MGDIVIIVVLLLFKNVFKSLKDFNIIAQGNAL